MEIYFYIINILFYNFIYNFYIKIENIPVHLSPAFKVKEGDIVFAG